jgi:hypothetical protein
MNRLHKGTALLIRAVLRMADERGGPYVTYRIAAYSLVAGRTSEFTGGCRAVEDYRFRVGGFADADAEEAWSEAIRGLAESECQS